MYALESPLLFFLTKKQVQSILSLTLHFRSMQVKSCKSTLLFTCFFLSILVLFCWSLFSFLSSLIESGILSYGAHAVTKLSLVWTPFLFYSGSLHFPCFLLPFPGQFLPRVFQMILESHHPILLKYVTGKRLNRD